jgi:hypothetical protein
MQDHATAVRDSVALIKSGDRVFLISIAHPDFRTDLRREVTSIRRVVLPGCNYP